MKFFIDTANLEQIQEAYDLGVLDGVTTNPSLMAKGGIKGTQNQREHYVKICKIVEGDVSAEVIATDYEGMIREGEELAALNPHIVVKVPCIEAGIKAIKYFTDKIEKLTYIDGKSDWIDLRASEEVEMKAGEFKLIPLGVAMELPKGYEAHIMPRSSTYKNFGIIQANSCGIVDGSYCGDNDMWRLPAIAMRDTVIHVNDRIAQFRIVENQPQIHFEEVESLGNQDRGGFGSTGIQ